ncbi:MAG: M48 family metallopeptidase [Chitinophagaceae bacterium]|nr:M48 family metallopeptidase [Chitinophagaceae bacterium]
MSTNPTISVGQFKIEIVRKDIKNMHLAVYPPYGRIRLAAPYKTDGDVVRLFAVSKLGWIKKNIKNFKEQPRETPREYVPGETHYYRGKRYLLRVLVADGPQLVKVGGTRYIVIKVRPSSTLESRAQLLKEWYRAQLKKELPALIEKWERVIGVKCNSWGVKQMKTKWGSCTNSSKRIWLNLELAKKPSICLEFIVCHELIHLLERNHNERFVSMMNKHMPKWRQYREVLNRLPVAHNEWEY